MWLKNHVEDAIQPVFKKHSSIYYKIIFNWPLIVGANLRDKVFPVGIRSSAKESTDTTLLLEVKNPCHGLEAQMMSGTILDKISVYFGYKAVSKIKIIITNSISDETVQEQVPIFSDKKQNLNISQDIVEIISQNQNDEIKVLLMNIARQL